MIVAAEHERNETKTAPEKDAEKKATHTNRNQRNVLRLFGWESTDITHHLQACELLAQRVTKPLAPLIGRGGKAPDADKFLGLEAPGAAISTTDHSTLSPWTAKPPQHGQRLLSERWWSSCDSPASGARTRLSTTLS